MPTYKTPDVYVEEISVLPPSVAEVSTAVPAFIGYTDTARDKGTSLLNKPVRITSFKEYQEFFGGRAQKNISRIDIDARNQVSSVAFAKRFYLHDALYMYFLNGGGCCYIVSLGNYDSDPATGKEATLAALASLESEDEITLFVMPDLVSLGGSMYSVQQAALAQCAKLKNRFAILDVREDPHADQAAWSKEIQTFRDRIGVLNLSYGAAYTPYIRADLTIPVTFGDVRERLFKTGENNPSPLETLDPSEGTVNAVKKLTTALDDQKEYASRVNRITASDNGLDAGAVRVIAIKRMDDAAKKDSDEAKLQARTDILSSILTELYHAWAPAPPEGYHALSGDLQQFVRDSLTSALPATIFTPDTFFDSDFTRVQPVIASTVQSMALTQESAREYLDALLSVVESGYAAITTNIARYEAGLAGQSFLYCAIQRAALNALCTMPPSGAVAGLYAQTDRQRGVWKAPANVSLSTTQGLSQSITSAMQEDLNVDTQAGKSINAIRAFPGKGILVWGARTLDGNNNEWRYVPVRRFFIMAEESIRRASFWAVFEPNDANLWVKVKAMIENYLLEKWKDGALAGAAPADAFYVNVGLGSTMTSQDILEGRLIVDIGMAVVRPAEFIVLRFMHKMQQS